MSEYTRLTKKGGFTKNLDLSQELGYSNIYSRLSELEDKIESGLLHESPCKVGDIIYFNTYDRCKNIGIQPHKVKSIRVVIITEKSFPGSTDTEVYAEEIGDCVFLDKDQAEEWLKGLREGKK